MVKLLAMRYLGGRRLMKRSEVLPLFILHVCLVPLKLLPSDKSDVAKHTLSFCINTIFSHLPISIMPVKDSQPENQGKGGIVSYAICRVSSSP